MPEISIIICHHKGNLLAKAIDSLLESREVSAEIIVATSAPVNVEYWRAKYPTVRFLEILGGPAYKRNVAAKFATAPFLAFYDDDIEAMPYSLFRLKDFLEKHPEAGMTFGKLLNMEFRKRFDEAGSYLTSTGFLWARAESGIEDKGQFDLAVQVLAGKSAACMVRKKVFWSVGGFDPSYEILGEETDFAWRIWLSGYSVWYVPQSVTYHAFNTRFKPVDFYVPRRVYFNGCRNYLSMLFTNLGNLRMPFAVMVQIVVWIAAGMGMLVTGKYEAGINIFKGLWYFFYHLRVLHVKRRKIQSTRKIKDSKLMPIVLKNPPVSYYVKRFFHYIYTGRHG